MRRAMHPSPSPNPAVPSRSIERGAALDQATFDRQMMANAVTMARRGLGQTAPNPSVGAVIANETTGEVIARGWTQPGGRPHAETVALARAGDKARGATLYVTLEPCSHQGQTGPCADAIIASGIARVVAGIGDPDTRVAGQGFAKLRAAGIEVVTGVMADAARWVTLGHVLRVTENRPFIQLKLALDANGRVAPGTNGAPAWVTGPQARAAGHLLRAEADAIVVGVNTVIADDPELTCRLPGLAARSPERVIIDTHLRTPPTAKVLRAAAEGPRVTIATALHGNADQAAALRGAGATVLFDQPLDASRQRLDLAVLATRLATNGITRLLVEGGPTLWRSFADLGLVDEVVLFMANAKSGVELSSPSARVRAHPERLIPRELMKHAGRVEGLESGVRPAGSDPALERARRALAMYLGDLPLHLVECRNLGPDTLWRMIVRRAD